MNGILKILTTNKSPKKNEISFRLINCIISINNFNQWISNNLWINKNKFILSSLLSNKILKLNSDNLKK